MNTTNHTPKTYKQIIQDNIIRLTTHANVSYRGLSAAIDASTSYIQKVVEGRYAPSSKELVTEITDHLIKLEDKNLEFVLTITKELYNKQN